MDSTFFRTGPPLAPALILIASALAACSSDEGAASCADDGDCLNGYYCAAGVCRPEPEDDPRRRPDADTGGGDDVPAVDLVPDPDAEIEPDEAGDAPGEAEDDACVADCEGRQCGVDPVCGESCGPDCPEGETCSDGVCTPEDDPLADLSPECAGFCDALCDFLLECGKDDPTCLDRCGASARYQQLSTSACTEGAHVIGLEDCRLWLDCGGRSCAIDEMCLELIPNYSYACAPICDHTQTQPACPAGDDCSTVADANGSVMTALGMCFSLF